MDKKIISIIDDLNDVQRDLSAYSYLLTTMLENNALREYFSSNNDLSAQFNSLYMIVDFVNQRVIDNKIHLGVLNRICSDV